MGTYLWIGLGGALGSMARYGFSGAAAAIMGGGFPYGTMFVNITGALIIGFIATLTGPDGRLLAGTTTRQFLMVGICGGYTTFSSFSLETLNLMRDGQWFKSGVNIVLSVLLCLVAVWLGHIAAASLNQLQG